MDVGDLQPSSLVSSDGGESWIRATATTTHQEWKNEQNERSTPAHRILLKNGG